MAASTATIASPGRCRAYLLISTFYGLQVNTLNDIAVHDDRWRQRIRPKPKLPNQVYSFDPATKDVRVIADGFGHPNGITFSSDQKSISLVVQRPMVRALRKITCLQLFHTKGNVYSGYGDGVNMWSPGGALLGNIIVKNGTSEFSFGRGDRIYILNQNKLYSVQLNHK
ncbi:hypothetical protein N7471_005573 [Penicillium samsonianum]|uniref:uncharacterized protein n=1 Tax=Penicillium samsonianum TaxID=1882272 RepID=UPI002548E67B|nr:uncharacterized protein N7471_005573 [Penicillium samsonianum]KAJ6139087.1 hypothetical protein N7471_005573 [Penicillium samsonianum]